MMTHATPEPGLYVDGWYGHYLTSQALLRALELGWDPDDRREVVALALTYQASGHLGVTLDDANAARTAAGIAVIGAEELDDPNLGDTLGCMLDDAEAWLDEHCAPDGHYWGSHPDAGGWGLWSIDDE